MYTLIYVVEEYTAQRHYDSDTWKINNAEHLLPTYVVCTIIKEYIHYVILILIL